MSYTIDVNQLKTVYGSKANVESVLNPYIKKYTALVEKLGEIKSNIKESQAGIVKAAFNDAYKSGEGKKKIESYIDEMKTAVENVTKEIDTVIEDVQAHITAYQTAYNNIPEDVVEQQSAARSLSQNYNSSINEGSTLGD